MAGFPSHDSNYDIRRIVRTACCRLAVAGGLAAGARRDQPDPSRNLYRELGKSCPSFDCFVPPKASRSSSECVGHAIVTLDGKDASWSGAGGRALLRSVGELVREGCEQRDQRFGAARHYVAGPRVGCSAAFTMTAATFSGAIPLAIWLAT